MNKIILITFLASYPALASEYIMKLPKQPTKVVLNTIPENPEDNKEEGENGICGTSQGMTLRTVPTTNLCQTEYGNSNVIENNGIFTWSCNGSTESTTHAAGNSTDCSANKQEGDLICSVEFSNMNGYSYKSAALAQIEFTLKDNSKFSFGSLLSSTPTSGNFSNATVVASSVYSSYLLYYATYAIKGFAGKNTGYLDDNNEYWFGAPDTVSNYRVNFKEGQELSSVTYADKSHYGRYAADPRFPANLKYNISTFDCSGNLMKTYPIYTLISPAERQAATFTFD